jgi:hypothetical protein
MRIHVLASIAVVVALGCASSTPKEPATGERAASEPASKAGACAGATCDACVQESGCSFAYASGMCLTGEQAALCTGETCASETADCRAHAK